MVIPEQAWSPLDPKTMRDLASAFDDELVERLCGGDVRVAGEPYIEMMYRLHTLFADRDWFPGRCHVKANAALELADRRVLDLRAEDTMDQVRALWADPDQRVLVAVPNFGAFEMTWARYVDAFERGYFASLWVLLPDLSREYFVFEGEFGVEGRTRADEIDRIVRITHKRTPRGAVVPHECLGVGFGDGRFWESERFGHNVDRDAMLAMEAALVTTTGLDAETCECSPWIAGEAQA